MSSSSAVDGGRLRQTLQQAQAQIQDLRALPLTDFSNRQCFPSLFGLARLVHKIVSSAAAMDGDPSAATIWRQRATWLAEEVASLVAERVFSPDPKVQGSNLLGLLFAAADACEDVVQEKAAAEAQCRQLEEAVREAGARSEAAEARLRQASAQAEQAAASRAGDELLALKSKLGVLQEANAAALAHQEEQAAHIRALVAEGERLAGQVDELSVDKAELQEQLEGQAEVIRQMMAKNEEAASAAQRLGSEQASVAQHNKALSQSLETNARVIERLIDLNTELMDAVNIKSVKLDAASRLATLSPGASVAASNVLLQHDAPRQLSHAGAPGPSAAANAGMLTPTQQVHVGNGQDYQAAGPRALDRIQEESTPISGGPRTAAAGGGGGHSSSHYQTDDNTPARGPAGADGIGGARGGLVASQLFANALNIPAHHHHHHQNGQLTLKPATDHGSDAAGGTKSALLPQSSVAGIPPSPTGTVYATPASRMVSLQPGGAPSSTSSAAATETAAQHGGGGGASKALSFADAFSSFLTALDSPEPATASTLSVPAVSARSKFRA